VKREKRKRVKRHVGVGRGDSLSPIFTHIRREREGEQEGRPTPINEKRGERGGGGSGVTR